MISMMNVSGFEIVVRAEVSVNVMSGWEDCRALSGKLERAVIGAFRLGSFELSGGMMKSRIRGWRELEAMSDERIVAIGSYVSHQPCTTSTLGCCAGHSMARGGTSPML